MSQRHALNLKWLIQLRWGAAAGQALVILLVHLLMEVHLPLSILLGLVAFEAVSNLVCSWWARRRDEVPEGLLAGLLGFDVLVLTGLLYFSGGSFNPFNFLYLVYVALAAVVLRARWTWALVVLSLVCFGALFLDHVAMAQASHVDHAAQMEIHLRGMWVAFAVAAGFIVYFVHRITNALADRDAQLAAARERNARSERLASLATLAAGAAHELSTPMSTIALVAGELEAAVARGLPNERIGDDLALIQSEVKRCRAILEQMSTEAGDSPGAAPETITLAALLQRVVAEVDRPNEVLLTLSDDAARRRLRVPVEATVRALRGLVDNACDASPTDAAVVVEGDLDGTHVRIRIRDEGPGMAEEVLARAGEPFFTTKEPGRGMGLGLFLARAITEQLGGSLTLDSRVDEGTVARVTLPCEAPLDHQDATNDHIARAAAVAGQ